ncbi:hypothetical protein DFP72DRAFT_553185 [Ephemerocybe angulata]|uniref:Arrestin-like N-terminal domain-containing protein n=1 Tax=Ephemerocybe angulata TaxID=980116 RepID=A0A8H6HL36_9AGAR|nr:hypothetical protein DFP72DRAFT_553185 [Tulosesus angulatus]
MAQQAPAPPPFSASASSNRLWTMDSHASHRSTGSSQRHGRRHSHIPTISSLDASPASTSPPSYQGTGVSRMYRRSGRRLSHQPLPAYGQAVALDSQRAGEDASHHGGVGRHQQEFYIRSGSGHDARVWATLKVDGRAEASTLGSERPAGRVPKFCGGDAISGTIALDLEKPLTINSITLTLRGRYITGFLEEGAFVFLNQVTPIWDKNAGDPRLPHPSPLDFDGSKKTKFNAKLEGSYTWPFSLHFPTEIVLPTRSGPQQVIQTPQSFLERGIGANIQYQLVMHITHGMFKANSKLQVGIQYEPTLSPPPASFLRQQAYLQGGFLLPPSEDPTGWHPLPDTCFRHHYKAADLDLNFTLSLAQPLSYTRGTTIPCFLSLSANSDAQTDLPSLLLSNSRAAFELQLKRRVTFLPDAGAANALLSSKAIQLRNAEECVANAVWWLPAALEGAQSAWQCYLEGEIHLPTDLSPSCQARLFSVQYLITLVAKVDSSQTIPTPSSPSSAARSGRASSTSQIPPSQTTSPGFVDILSYPVSITTFHVHGPLPTPFTMTPKRSGRHDNSGSRSNAKRALETIQYEEVFGEGSSASWQKNWGHSGLSLG